LALKKGVKVEDAVIGVFVLLALLYPLLITYLIHSQKREENSEEVGVLRRVYLFVTGLEDCSPGNRRCKGKGDREEKNKNRGLRVHGCRGT